MRASVNGIEVKDCISADPSKGEAVCLLRDADGNVCKQPNGEDDTVTKRGEVVILEEKKADKKWQTSQSKSQSM